MALTKQGSAELSPADPNQHPDKILHNCVLQFGMYLMQLDYKTEKRD